MQCWQPSIVKNHHEALLAQTPVNVSIILQSLVLCIRVLLNAAHQELLCLACHEWQFMITTL